MTYAPLLATDAGTSRDVPEEVTQAPIETYSDAALVGRLIHYQREALFERDPERHEAWTTEAARTAQEIKRRSRLARAPAEALFAK